MVCCVIETSLRHLQRSRHLLWLMLAWIQIWQHPLFGQTSIDPIDGIRQTGIPLVALEADKIHLSDGRVLEKGTILIRDGRIVEVGQSIEIPPGTEILRYPGKEIYPGWIDAYSEWDLVESGEPPAGHWNRRITPQRRIADLYTGDEERLKKYREAGITAIVAAPQQGIIKGTSCVVATASGKPGQRMLKEIFAQHLRLTTSFGGAGGYPTSPMGAVAVARQTLLDAQWYRSALDTALASPQIAAPDFQASLQALMEQTESGVPVVIDTTNEQHAMRADRFAREFQLPLILRGSGREYRLLEKVASLQRPIVLPVDFPKAPNVASAESASLVPVQDLMHWEWAPRNPALLHQAQVLFALTSHGLEDPKELRSRVMTAIEHGLPAEVAFDALTEIPAKLLGIDKTHGQIARGFSADLLITDGPLLDRKSKLMETWVQGERFQWENTPDNSWKGSWVVQWNHPVRGLQKYLLEVEESGKSTISWWDKGSSPESSSLLVAAPEEGSSPAPAAPAAPDSASKGIPSASRDLPSAQLDQLQRSKERLAGSFESSSLEPYQLGRGQWSLTKLESVDYPDRAYGNLRWPDGSIVALTAERREVGETSQGDSEKKDKKTPKVAKEGKTPSLLSDRVHPWSAFGRKKNAEPVQLLLIKNATIWTGGPEGILEGADLLCRDGKIERVGRAIEAPEGALVIDATGKHVSPGIIDCHSHMATDGGVNEVGQSVTAEVRIGDFIDSTDDTIYYQLAGGVTASNILHGSANPIGGQNQVIKLRWGEDAESLKMKEAPAGIKFALGENVKQSNRSPGEGPSRYPQTRMGVEQIIRDRLQAAKEYQQRWDAWRTSANGIPPRRDLELEALSEILQGKRWIHCHSYRQDEILAMLRTLEDYQVTIGSLQHILEGYKVAEAMARHGAMGSSFSDWWGYKFEVIDAIPFNGALMHRMGIVVSFNSDDNELGTHLNHEAAKAVKYGGLDPHTALQFVTLNPAKQLRIDRWVGSLEPGKHADFVLWNGSPLSTRARCEQTWIEGAKFFDRQEDIQRRQENQVLHQKLVQRILREEVPMAEAGRRPLDESMLWPRHDEYCHHKHGEEDHFEGEEE